MVVDRKKNTERNLQLNLSMTFFESEKEIEKITGGGHRCPRCETRNYNKGISERVLKLGFCEVKLNPSVE